MINMDNEIESKNKSYKEQDLISRLPPTPIDENSFKKVSILELHRYPYKLLDIDMMDSDAYKNVYKQITYLNLSNNFISNLKLKGYNSLATLIATNNHIAQVDLNLQNLKKLYLNKNSIKKMFELMNLPSLIELNLSQNSIVTVTYDSFRSVKNSLTTIDISQNLLEFSDVKEFCSFFDTFGKCMKKINVIQIMGNPFIQNKQFREYYQAYIRSACSKLKVLDYKSIEGSEKMEMNVIKEKMLEMEKTECNIPHTQTHTEKKKFYGPVTLKLINKEILRSTQVGKFTDSNLDDIVEMIDVYMKDFRSETTNESGRLEDTELDEFELFLDLIEKLIDSSPNYEKKLYTQIGKFALIKQGKFTSRALSCLKQRTSSEKMEDIIGVIRDLERFIIHQSEEELPPQIVEGLELFLHESKLEGPIMNVIRYLMTLGVQFKNIKIVGGITNEEIRRKELYLSTIAFLANSSTHQTYLLEILSKNSFIEAISTQLTSLLSENDEKINSDFKALTILQYLLEIVRVVCLSPEKKLTDKLTSNINNLVGGGLKDKIEHCVIGTLQELAKGDNANEMTEVYMREKNYNKNMKFGNLIRAYGAMIHRSRDIANYLDLKSTPMKIVNLIVQTERNDPIIISASCDFILYFLKNSLVKENESYLNIITTKLYNFRYLLPYLFETKQEFIKACILAGKYGQNTLERGKPIELTHMNSKLINKLVISIAKLMEYFGKYSKKPSNIQQHCIDICRDLNDQKRDEALCTCLRMPNEEVKLAMVECLFSMNCSELDTEEVGLIYKQMSHVNLMTGNIELIVTVIFLLLNKWFFFHLVKSNWSHIDTNKEAIFLALDILHKNELRTSIAESESQRKAMLSVTIIAFLINISADKYTSKFFLDPRNIDRANQILYFEEKFVEKSFTLPLEIEKCHSGWHILNLIKAIREGKISPYTYVSLRIMIHIADLLLNRKYPTYEIDSRKEYSEILEYLEKETIKRERQRFQNESLSWRELNDFKFQEEKQYKQCVTLSKEDLLEEQNNFLKSFEIMVAFVQGQSTQEQISQFSDLWDKKCDPQMEQEKFSIFETEEGLKSKTMEEAEEESKEINEDENIFETLKGYLREEEYYSTAYTEILNPTYDYVKDELYRYHLYGIEENLVRVSEEESPNNPYIRSLFIAAFFRCIYAMLENPKEKVIKDQMVKKLYQKDHIKILCKLADSTQFKDNNIASKFLIIMKHVLRNSQFFYDIKHEEYKAKKKEELDNEYLSKLGIISYMIRKIIRVFKKDLKVESNDHRILLSEICQCSAIILNELQMLKFSTEEIRIKTLETMIDYEVINTFIFMIRDYMNKDAEFFKSALKDEASRKKDQFGDQLLNEMISISVTIIGEYMARCPNREYDILENFTRSYIFDHVKMRKTFIREIIEYSEYTRLRVIISNHNNSTEINYVAPVFLTDYENKQSRNYLMAITDTEIYFVRLSTINEVFKMNHYEFELFPKLVIEDIMSVICFDYVNRILIETRDHHFGMFFYTMNVASIFKKMIKEINNNIVLFENVYTFPTEPEPQFDAEDIPTPINGYTPIIEESPSGENKNSIPILQNESNQNYEMTTIIGCNIDISNLFDFFYNLFNRFELIPNAKVVVLRGTSFKIYKEKYADWQKLNVKDLFLKANRFVNNPSNINIGNFENCFNEIKEYDVLEIKGMQMIRVDELVLTLSSRSPDKPLIIQLNDDLSYVKFKRHLCPYLQFDKDDYIDSIFK